MSSIDLIICLSHIMPVTIAVLCLQFIFVGMCCQGILVWPKFSIPFWFWPESSRINKS